MRVVSLLVVLVGVGLILTAIFLLAGLPWTLLAAGVLLVASQFPAPASRRPAYRAPDAPTSEVPW